jgi:hypothetical protein
MRNRLITATSIGWLALLATATGVPPAARGAERIVLGEEFTATWCTYCAQAGPRLSTLLSTYPNTFAFVQIHHGDDYATTWGNARFNFYSCTGYPTLYWDGGLIADVGAMAYSTYLAHYNTRRAAATNVKVFLSAEEVSSNTFDVTATVYVEPTGSGRSMRIYTAQVLDHWPTYNSYSRNGFKQAAATQDITLNPGQWQRITRRFTFDSYSMTHTADIKIIAWAQEPQSSSPPSNRAEVFQAGIMPWPLPEMPLGDANCDGLTDNFDITPFVLALTDPYTYWQTYGCLPNCDVNLDGAVDNFDITPFVALLAGG